MAYDYERDQLLTYPMIAFQLLKEVGSNTHFDALARFNYQEDNIYFFEKYVNQEYENPDGGTVSWYEFSQYRDLRNDEVEFLKSLQKQKLISNLKIDTAIEHDYAETGKDAERPSKYHFDINDGFIETLEKYQYEADEKIYLEGRLEISPMLFPIVYIGERAYKQRAISPDSKPGKIIEYCHDNRLNQVATLEELREHISLNGVKDIKTALRGSVFYSDGVLKDFVEVNSSRITLKSQGRILLSDFRKMQLAE